MASDKTWWVIATNIAIFQRVFIVVSLNLKKKKQKKNKNK